MQPLPPKPDRNHWNRDETMIRTFLSPWGGPGNHSDPGGSECGEGGVWDAPAVAEAV